LFKLSRLLENQGPGKALRISKILQEPKARDILYRDVYGWFTRVSHGVYELSPLGKQEIPLWHKAPDV